MGKLMNRDRMREAKRERERRAERILKAGREAFVRFPYAEVTLDKVGQQAKVKQGQASLAFRSREELFLTVLRPLLEDWYGAVAEALRDDERSFTTSELAELVASTLNGRPDLTRLLGSLHTALELHDEGFEVQTFLQWQRDRLLEIGEAVNRRIPAVHPWEAFDALYRGQLMAAAVHPVANPVGNLAVDLMIEDHQVFALDLEDEVRRVVLDSLGG